MSDLISRQALKKVIENWMADIMCSDDDDAANAEEEALFSVCCQIDSQPTAYDVEAVVRELEKNKRGFFILDGVTVRTIPLDKAIEIVKRGGRNEID